LYDSDALKVPSGPTQKPTSPPLVMSGGYWDGNTPIISWRPGVHWTARGWALNRRNRFGPLRL